MVRCTCIVFALMTLSSCFHKRFNQKHFKLSHKIKINQEALNTNGYYYSIYELNKSYNREKGHFIRMRIFLDNGYTYFVKNGFSNLCGDSITIDCAIQKSEYMLDKYIKYKYEGKRNSLVNLWDWGKYEIKNDTIFIQWYYNHRGDYYLVEEEGVILDSTSFKLFRMKDYKTKEEEKIDELYQFKEYDVSKMYDKIPENL